MKHIRGLLSTTQALRQIFLGPQAIPRAQCFRYSPTQTSSQLRLLHSHRRSIPSPTPAVKPEQLVNEAIAAEYVQVVDENNKLGPPEKLRHVLRFLNRSEDFLLQVSPGSPERPPVCKIINHAAFREQERAQATQAKVARAKIALKQIELNWAIDPHDLSHRLRKLTDFLEKGRKVEIVLVRKKRKRAPTVEEIKNVMTTVLQVTKDANATQIKPMEGEPGKHVVLVVQKKDA
ncbi:hypothetical protein BDW59DRAFT_143105 [Aspergillus cavernicola]|uniref:Translation initiation factor 3 N-terminal domain-containing protein n=1 Tax=Aspergillus cavernicola TaxID=176166 RepID=A0ABR4INT3_9EURO